MVDAGAVIKLRRARIGVGSSSPVATQDKSGGALQILGTPVFATASGNLIPGDAVPGRVFLTSLSDGSVGGVQSANPARAGDWGGVDFRSDIDKADENRTDLEEQGIFLNSVQWADIRYGGGSVLVEGRPDTISPIEMSNARPFVGNSRITLSADSAMEATPDSFEETKYARQSGQGAGDYVRVGPDLRGNTITDNSINGLFVRTATRDGSNVEQLHTRARFNDRDVVHVLGENLSLAGTPGGLVQDASVPSLLTVRTSVGLACWRLTLICTE